MKRDDCTGLATGGNKTRKLEFSLGEALAATADTVVTSGALQLFDAHIHPCAEGLTAAAQAKVLAAEPEQEGRRPCLLPPGGSSASEALGYVVCAYELLEQCGTLELRPTELVLGSASGATQAGLVAGFTTAAADLAVLGICSSATAPSSRRGCTAWRNRQPTSTRPWVRSHPSAS